MSGAALNNEVLDEDEGAEIELDMSEEEIEASKADSVNPNIADQLNNAQSTGEGEDTRTPEERVMAYLETDESLKEYGDGIQKRINKLTYNWREAERREQAAITYAENVKKEIEALRARQEEQDGVFVNEYTARVKAELDNAKYNLKQAYELGDAELIAEANANVARFSADLASAEQTANRYQRQRQMRPQQQPQYQQPQYQQPQRPVQRPQPDERATDWASKNEWFGTDRIMTNAALEIHRELVEEEGFTPQSDNYYTEIDRRIRSNFPHKFKQPAPVSNASVTPGVNNAPRKPGKRSVKLTASQVSIAKKLGVPLEEYAKYV